MSDNFTTSTSKSSDINSLLGNTDIYLVDQIMKDRYSQGAVVLDAGCGEGRNLHWFIKNFFSIYGIDTDEAAINELKRTYKKLPADRFQVGAIEAMPFRDAFFDAVISSAVLHFATGEAHFFAMLSEMIRVLKRGGTLFIRMTSDIGIENKVQLISNGIYNLPDGSTRFLLTRDLFSNLMSAHPVSLLDEFKTVNVNDLRCMSTIVLRKL